MTKTNKSARTSTSPGKVFKTPELVIAGLTPDELRGLKDVFLGEFAKDLDRRKACESCHLKPRELALLLRDDSEFRAQVEGIKGADDALLADKAREVLWDLLSTGSEAIRAQLLKHVESTRAGYSTRTQADVSVKDQRDSCHPDGIDTSEFKLKHSQSGEAVKPVPAAALQVDEPEDIHEVEFH